MGKILVTGGAGFIGSHLCERLLAMNHYVIALDNFYTGVRKNLKKCFDHPRFSFEKRDVRDPMSFDTDFTHIFNFACPASPPAYQKDPIYTTKTSVLGAIHTAELALKCKATLVHASTSEVYGDPKEHPQRETYWGCVNPAGLRSCYDEGKRCAESLLYDYHRLNGIDVKVVRIFNTYGPQMDPQDGRVVTNFLSQALEEKPLTLFGDGSQTRSFCYISDLLDGIVSYGLNAPPLTGPMNLGNPNEFTMKELAHKVLKLTGSTSKIVYRPLPSDDPTRRQPDITLAKRTLNWSPKIALDDGLKLTLDWYKSQRGNKR